MLRGHSASLHKNEQLRKELEELEAAERSLLKPKIVAEPVKEEDEDEDYEEDQDSLEPDEEIPEEVSGPGSYIWPTSFSRPQLVELGRRMRLLREQAQFTQGQLERMAKLKPSELSVIENGRKIGLDKATIKRIGHYLRNDFNEIVKEICATKYAAAPASESLTFVQEQKYRVAADGFDFRIAVDGDEFRVTSIIGEQEIQLYKGRRSRDSVFCQGLRKMISLIAKGS